MLSFILFGFLGYRYSHWIHKHQYVLYGLAPMLLTLGLLLNIEPLTSGELSIGFFMIVMFAGSLPPKTTLSKRLRSIRKEYSITGFILASIHALYFLFEGQLAWVGIITYILMISLTIISLDQVRRKITAKTWKNIQKAAYPIYLGLWIHIMLMGEFAFSIPFAIYLVMKIRFEWQKVKQKRLRMILKTES